MARHSPPNKKDCECENRRVSGPDVPDWSVVPSSKFCRSVFDQNFRCSVLLFSLLPPRLLSVWSLSVCRLFRWVSNGCPNDCSENSDVRVEGWSVRMLHAVGNGGDEGRHCWLHPLIPIHPHYYPYTHSHHHPHTYLLFIPKKKARSRKET